MSVTQFRLAPLTAIIESQDDLGLFSGNYAGDQWTEPFRMESGKLWLVMDALHNHRRKLGGLPVVHATPLEPGNGERAA